MLSVGAVMFWKAVVLALWASFKEWREARVQPAAEQITKDGGLLYGQPRDGRPKQAPMLGHLRT